MKKKKTFIITLFNFFIISLNVAGTQQYVQTHAFNERTKSLKYILSGPIGKNYLICLRDVSKNVYIYV